MLLLLLICALLILVPILSIQLGRMKVSFSDYVIQFGNRTVPSALCANSDTSTLTSRRSSRSGPTNVDGSKDGRRDTIIEDKRASRKPWDPPFPKRETGSVEKGLEMGFRALPRALEKEGRRESSGTETTRRTVQGGTISLRRETSSTNSDPDVDQLEKDSDYDDVEYLTNASPRHVFKSLDNEDIPLHRPPLQPSSTVQHQQPSQFHRIHAQPLPPSHSPHPPHRPSLLTSLTRRERPPPSSPHSHPPPPPALNPQPSLPEPLSPVSLQQSKLPIPPHHFLQPRTSQQFQPQPPPSSSQTALHQPSSQPDFRPPPAQSSSNISTTAPSRSSTAFSCLKNTILIFALLLGTLLFAILVAHCLASFLVYKTEARLGELRRGVLRGGEMRVCLCSH